MSTKSGELQFNVGSVGNPLDVTHTSYAVLEGCPEEAAHAPWALNMVRVPYDIELAIRHVHDEAMPDTDKYAFELRTARYRSRMKA